MRTELTFDNILFETSKFLKPEYVNNLIDEADDTKIRNFFGIREWVTDYPYAITHTFDFNPYVHFKNLEEIAGYFYYYYQFSDTALLIPNIKLESKGKRIMSGNDYLKYIKDAHSILNRKNNKRPGLNQTTGPSKKCSPSPPTVGKIPAPRSLPKTCSN